MSHILTLKLNDRVFAAIQQQAKNIGIAPESLAEKLLEQKFSQIFRHLLTDAEKESRRARFERHFGAIDLGFSIDLDNESIDADLAKEYSNTHEEE
jgi:predicted lipid carrier protein YhbT